MRAAYGKEKLFDFDITLKSTQWKSPDGKAVLLEKPAKAVGREPKEVPWFLVQRLHQWNRENQCATVPQDSAHLR